jgi:ABC-2 type transport system ATP-binding protein
MAPAIHIDELTKDYAIGFWRRRPYRALDRLTLDIEAGEVFGFLGPNGAGKTTTLKLLMQLIFPSSGRAEILGRPAGDLGVRQRIGYLPENPSFYDYLTAEELLGYFAQLFGYRGADRARRVAALLDRVGIGAERRLQLRKFSKGMIQRVGIAQALLNDPEVVFLDEPMSGLDPLGRRDVRALILELRDQGRTVFFSSHILADAEVLCRRVAVVVEGRLAAAGRLSDILAFQVRGWELVVANLRPEVLSRVSPITSRVTEIAHGRYALELPLEQPPARVLADLVASGATLVSLNPVRDTLEDFFVRQVAGERRREAPPAPRPFDKLRVALSRVAGRARSEVGSGPPRAT